MRKVILILFGCWALWSQAQRPRNVVDEVIWVVGDDPIYLSDVEQARLYAESEGQALENPYCTIPEQIAIQKLYLHQAEIDSITVSEGDIIRSADEIINRYIQNIGSKEGVEAVMHKSISQLREEFKRSQRDRMRIQREQQRITEKVAITPAEVREYFKNLPADSLPLIPTQIEVEIITAQPQPTRAEVERIENKLRSFADRVNSGETEFSTLARFYSQDPGSSRNGGEMDYMGRGQLVPEFANAAFSLSDPKKVSKIVKTEFGYHIIQLVDKRGDKVKVRHILLKPDIPADEFARQEAKLDSIAILIREHKLSFEDAAAIYSDDKDTRNNKGLMSYVNPEDGMLTARFQLKDLNQSIAQVIDTMKVGEISKAITMTNAKGQDVCAIVKLKARIDAHRANLKEDFQKLRDVVYEKRCNEKLDEWIANKIKTTYVRINPGWKNCTFKYKGWIKE
ncbi:peptidylprolyl isomerase [Alloprevotella tannerae]|uniref:Peptidylprolyl isomerase n=1 Tax=Alloprevotella tannerae TaxID=76122 RepID=A0A929RVS3_9BACT|nr:peptidylprolyl isomerase [Alloprevotella tannerae]MBF0970155.1 peptidylprolyl isomerase [Alloprevotella tannerae]